MTQAPTLSLPPPQRHAGAGSERPLDASRNGRREAAPYGAQDSGPEGKGGGPDAAEEGQYAEEEVEAGLEGMELDG